MFMILASLCSRAALRELYQMQMPRTDFLATWPACDLLCTEGIAYINLSLIEHDLQIGIVKLILSMLKF